MLSAPRAGNSNVDDLVKMLVGATLYVHEEEELALNIEAVRDAADAPS